MTSPTGSYKSPKLIRLAPNDLINMPVSVYLARQIIVFFQQKRSALTPKDSANLDQAPSPSPSSTGRADPRLAMRELEVHASHHLSSFRRATKAKITFSRGAAELRWHELTLIRMSWFKERVIRARLWISTIRRKELTQGGSARIISNLIHLTIISLLNHRACTLQLTCRAPSNRTF